MKAETEMGVMRPQVKEHQKPSKAARGKGAVSKCGPPDTLAPDLWPPELWDEAFLLF